MIYPQRDNRRKRNKSLLTAFVVGGVVLLVVVLNIFNPTFLSPVVHTAGRPVIEARGFFASVVQSVGFLRFKGNLIIENEQLKEKVALYEALQVERDYYKDQNQKILKASGRVDEEKNRVFARIISKPGFSHYDTMIIDVGTADGVAPGDHVLADGDLVLGKIDEAYEHTAVVSLYSSPDKETQVLIGESSIQAVAVGKGGGNFEVKLPRNTGVKVGDVVSMASSSTKIFGSIQYIHTSETDTFDKSLFKSSVDVSHLSFVIIEKQ